VSQVDYEGLQARYDAAQAIDPDGMQQLESDLGVSQKLPVGGLRGVLALLRAKSGDTLNGRSDAAPLPPTAALERGERARPAQPLLERRA
jgi:non-specific serine/threonine protein kinase